jgi:proliferating cell nuclear antigen
MFEAKLLNGNILKKIVEAIKDVVNDVNIDISPSGILQQASPNPFRSLIAGNGRLPCRIGFPQPEHGGI